MKIGGIFRVKQPRFIENQMKGASIRETRMNISSLIIIGI